MAKRPTPAPQSRRLTLDEQRSALSRLDARIKDVESLDTSKIKRGNDPAIQSVAASVRSTLASIFGEDSAEYGRLSQAADLDTTYYSMYTEPTEYEIREGVEQGKQRAVALLRGETNAFRESLEFAAPSPLVVEYSAPTTSDEIFIVHGRDEAAKVDVARVIERAGLKAVILHEQPNGGKTIIEKFEKHGSAAGFAVVVATPDDMGGLSSDKLQPRARQNVIGEMFWFAGRLGREKVCVLVKGAIDMPSDFAGVGYTPMDDHGGWKSKLLQELDAAGYKDLDWKKALA